MCGAELILWKEQHRSIERQRRDEGMNYSRSHAHQKRRHNCLPPGLKRGGGGGEKIRFDKLGPSGGHI